MSEIDQTSCTKANNQELSTLVDSLIASARFLEDRICCGSYAEILEAERSLSHTRAQLIAARESEAT